VTTAETSGPEPVDRETQDGDELTRLQWRLDELSRRIADAVPDGYDLEALVKASGEGHESEDVFDITGTLDALTGLTGPLNVPGRTPPPAFELDEEEEAAVARAEARHDSVRIQGMILLAVVILVIIGAVIGLFVIVPQL
jgi:hypothetical protein